MRTKRNGKIYDTDSARLIILHEGEGLYSKITGECFLCKDDRFVEALGLAEAQTWVETNFIGQAKSDALKKLPRRVTGDARVCVSAYLSKSDKERLEALRNARGFENADIMRAGIEALEMTQE